MLNFVVVNS